METLYRYVFTYEGKEFGGLFRGMNKALELLESLDAHNDDYNDVDYMFGELEYMLEVPKDMPSSVKFYYTEFGYNKVKDKVAELADILNEYYIDISLYKTTVGDRKVVYRDEYQVALED